MHRAISRNQGFMASLYRTLPAIATAVLALLAIGRSTPARAHGQAAMDLRLEIRGTEIAASTQLSLHDLGQMIALDSNGDGEPSPAEIEAARDVLGSHLARTLLIELPGSGPCEARLTHYRLSGVSSVAVGLRYRCPSVPRQLALRAGLFAGSHQHFRMHVEVHAGTAVHEAQLSDRHNRVELDLRGPPRRGLDRVIAVSLGVVVLSMIGTVVVAILGSRRRRKGDAPPES